MIRRDHWSEDGACATTPNVDPEQFYSNSDTERAEVIAYYCDPCPVRELCLRDAIHEEGTAPKRQYGIRGGMTGTDRRKYAIALAKEAVA